MELKFNIRQLLLALYEHKYNGRLYELGEIFGQSGLDISQHDIEEVAKTLSEDGLLKILSIGDTIYGQITVDGVECLEENNFFVGSNYLPQDMIKPLEREVMRHKVDALHAAIMASELGAGIPEETLTKEMEELKALLNILGRHSWLQILKGKVYELGEGKVSQELIGSLLQRFEARSATQGDGMTAT